MRWIIFFVMMGLGVYLLMRAFWIVNTYGHMGWAERQFGSGGTYIVWRLTGLALILGSFLMIRYGGLLGL